jgi:hypothetical protein
MLYSSEDNQGTSDCSSRAQSGKSMHVRDGNGTSMLNADFSSWNSGSVTLNYVVAAETGKHVGLFFAEPSAVTGNPWYAYAQQ